MNGNTQIALTRRHVLQWTSVVAVARPAWGFPTTVDRARVGQKIEGMLIGSLIGDAAGGPVEFRNPKELTEWLPSVSQWVDNQQLTPRRIANIANSFSLLPYTELRPNPAPYAHWTRNAAPGTITDDSRHKIPLIDALRSALANKSLPISRKNLAKAYVDFPETERIRSRAHYGKLCDEGLKEYLLAARWVLGERRSELAAPPERLWGGVATNAGQMALLPLAGALAGEPTAAYRAAFALGFMDNGDAKDINSAIVAGLAAAIGNHDQANPWSAIEDTMKTVDPFGYGQIPFVARPVTRWLETASSLATQADARPAKLFDLLRSKGQPRYYWDAHFVLVCAFAILKLCNYDPLCSLQLAIDFGHDTDSTAQLVGALIGAVHGPLVFPKAMRRQVTDRLREDFDEQLTAWVALLTELTDRSRYPSIAIS